MLRANMLVPANSAPTSAEPDQVEDLTNSLQATSISASASGSLATKFFSALPFRKARLQTSPLILKKPPQKQSPTSSTRRSTPTVPILDITETQRLLVASEDAHLEIVEANLRAEVNIKTTAQAATPTPISTPTTTISTSHAFNFTLATDDVVMQQADPIDAITDPSRAEAFVVNGCSTAPAPRSTISKSSHSNPIAPVIVLGSPTKLKTIELKKTQHDGPMPPFDASQFMQQAHSSMKGCSLLKSYPSIATSPTQPSLDSALQAFQHAIHKLIQIKPKSFRNAHDIMQLLFQSILSRKQELDNASGHSKVKLTSEQQKSLRALHRAFEKWNDNLLEEFETFSYRETVALLPIFGKMNRDMHKVIRELGEIANGVMG